MLTTVILTIGAFRILSPTWLLSCKVGSRVEYETVAFENTTRLAECKEELKEPFDKGERGE